MDCFLCSNSIYAFLINSLNCGNSKGFELRKKEGLVNMTPGFQNIKRNKTNALSMNSAKSTVILKVFGCVPFKTKGKQLFLQCALQ